MGDWNRTYSLHSHTTDRKLPTTYGYACRFIQMSPLGQDIRPVLSDIRASSSVPESEVAVQVGGGWELTQMFSDTADKMCGVVAHK